MSSGAPSVPTAGLFPQTRWSLVAKARDDDSLEAMETVCRTYWYPLYAYVRSCGKSPPDAQDLTQEFFRHLIEKGTLHAADREKGRLRTFLVTSLRNFLHNEWRRATAQRRGGGHVAVPIDTVLAESRFAEDRRVLPPETTFDKEWAMTLLDRSLSRLKEEFESAGKSPEFARLKSCLMAARGAIDYAATARDLGTSEGAARVAVHRMRHRFRELFREEISRTLAEDEDEDVTAELRHLIATLGH